MADLKASLCGELPNQVSAIPKEQLRSLLERRGIVGDPDIPNAKARLAEQELRRNMYHNIPFSWHHWPTGSPLLRQASTRRLHSTNRCC